MTTNRRAFVGSLAAAALAAKARSSDGPAVRMVTTLGEILVAVDSAHAPVTAANFLRYVDEKFYDGGAFHRTVTLTNQPTNTVKIEVIQAGINPQLQRKEFPPIALERTSVTGLRHLAGVISMARDGPDSATSDFFICVTDQPSLDFGGERNPDGQGFAAFGRVVRGLDIVRQIQQSKAVDQDLSPPVKIQSIRRD